MPHALAPPIFFRAKLHIVNNYLNIEYEHCSPTLRSTIVWLYATQAKIQSPIHFTFWWMDRNSRQAIAASLGGELNSKC